MSSATQPTPTKAYPPSDEFAAQANATAELYDRADACLLYTSPSPRD